MGFWSCLLFRCILDTFRFIFLKCLLIIILLHPVFCFFSLAQTLEFSRAYDISLMLMTYLMS